ncbi:Uncharacterised protein [Staphylococcus aureus]|nr:Uncharacterised protein [Staphylococcus aureus]CAC7007545.1 Uncharacterised protein [Staphylococcus aureus]
MKKAIAINQMLLLPKPATAVFMSTMPTSTMIVNPIIETAPIGIGCVIQAMIVATNIANIYHAVGSTVSGLKGVSAQIRRPTTIGSINLRYLTVFSMLKRPSFYVLYIFQFKNKANYKRCTVIIKYKIKLTKSLI